MILPWFSVTTSTLVRCRLAALLSSWCFCPKLIFASFLHGLIEAANLFLLLSERESLSSWWWKLTSEKQWVCSYHLSLLCSMVLTLYPTALELTGQAWGFPWFLGSKGEYFWVVMSQHGVSMEERVSKTSPWLKLYSYTTWITLLLPNQSSWPQIEGNAIALFSFHPLFWLQQMFKLCCCC